MFTGKGKVARVPGRRTSGKGKRMSGRVGCSIMTSGAAEKHLKGACAAKKGPIGLQELDRSEYSPPAMRWWLSLL